VPGYFLNDFSFARDLINELKIPNLKLQFDIYHCQIIHGDVTMRLREMMPIIGHVRSPAFLAQRAGRGGAELSVPVRRARPLGYKGFVGANITARQDDDGLGWFKPMRGETVTLASKISLGCIADDYTGASDLANTLTRAACVRCRPLASIGRPTSCRGRRGGGVAEKPPRSGPGLAVTRSPRRRGWPAAAGRRALCCFNDLLDLDSTDAGNIGPVMDAACAPIPAMRSLVGTPAFPEHPAPPSIRQSVRRRGAAE